MSEIYNNGCEVAHRLSEIEDKLQMRLEALGMYAQRAVKTAWHVGDLLVQAKAQVQHGGWLPWLERVGVDRRLAQRCMRLRDRYTLDGVQAHRSVDAALGAIAAPANATNLTHLTPAADGGGVPYRDAWWREEFRKDLEAGRVAPEMGVGEDLTVKDAWDDGKFAQWWMFWSSRAKVDGVDAMWQWWVEYRGIREATTDEWLDGLRRQATWLIEQETGKPARIEEVQSMVLRWLEEWQAAA